MLMPKPRPIPQGRVAFINTMKNRFYLRFKQRIMLREKKTNDCSSQKPLTSEDVSSLSKPQ